MRYMSKEILADQLAFIKEQAEFIQDTTSEITGVNDFLSSQSGMVLYNSTCMCLQTIGETVKKIDESTKGNFFSTYYPEIPWKSVIGLRNVISHEYQDTDHGEIFNIIKLDIPKLTLVVGTIINDVTSGRYDDFLNKKE